METSSHSPGVDDAKVPKLAATSPGRDDPVPETVASAPAVLSITDEGKKETVTGQGKSQQQQKPALKKPDKLAPCPRCESLDTKFCYYNNYNVNQPRHFCKSCQRYWTAGGTLRNVPVGAGRRKNKHGSLQARHGALPEQQVRLEPSVGVVAQPRPRSESVPDQISPPLASSSSDRSSQERGVSSGAVTHASSMHNAEAARRQYIPGTIRGILKLSQAFFQLEFVYHHRAFYCADFAPRFFWNMLLRDFIALWMCSFLVMGAEDWIDAGYACEASPWHVYLHSLCNRASDERISMCPIFGIASS